MGIKLRRWALSVALAIAWLMAIAGPVWAHGDHDARPLFRSVEAGPYTVSLWQVYPDTGMAMVPHLIVTFEGVAPESPRVRIQVGSTEMEVIASMTTPGAWETTVGVEADDLITVTITDPEGSWAIPTIVVPAPLTSVLPMRALIMVSIFLATAVAWWAAGRTARAWRRPLPGN